jgi:hypothetical protein
MAEDGTNEPAAPTEQVLDRREELRRHIVAISDHGWFDPADDAVASYWVEQVIRRVLLFTGARTFRFVAGTPFFPETADHPEIHGRVAVFTDDLLTTADIGSAPGSTPGMRVGVQTVARSSIERLELAPAGVLDEQSQFEWPRGATILAEYRGVRTPLTLPMNDVSSVHHRRELARFLPALVDDLTRPPAAP